jgi:hypothetical protein
MRAHYSSFFVIVATLAGATAQAQLPDLSPEAVARSYHSQVESGAIPRPIDSVEHTLGSFFRVSPDLRSRVERLNLSGPDFENAFSVYHSGEMSRELMSVRATVFQAWVLSRVIDAAVEPIAESSAEFVRPTLMRYATRLFLIRTAMQAGHIQQAPREIQVATLFGQITATRQEPNQPVAQLSNEQLFSWVKQFLRSNGYGANSRFSFRLEKDSPIRGPMERRTSTNSTLAEIEQPVEVFNALNEVRWGGIYPGTMMLTLSLPDTLAEFEGVVREALTRAHRRIIRNIFMQCSMSTEMSAETRARICGPVVAQPRFFQLLVRQARIRTEGVTDLAWPRNWEAAMQQTVRVGTSELSVQDLIGSLE